MDDDAEWFLHAGADKRLAKEGKGQWTTLYEQLRSDDESVGRYSTLASPDLRERVLRDCGWNLHIGDHSPGFSVWHENGHEVVQYDTITSEGFEPLVRVRSFDGFKPSQIEVSEEFRLFHNLWDGGEGNYYSFDETGTESLVLEISDDKVRVHTRLLRQYQAARQLDLLLFIETDRYSNRLPEGTAGFELEFKTDQIRARTSVGKWTVGGRHLCRFMGKQLVVAPPMNTCGIWPFEEPDNHFPEFPIGIAEDGQVVKHTCDPEQLANYFGKNPDSPHYLTPVFFQRDVLNRYYENPERFTIVDGQMYCGGLWRLRMDNDHANHIMVFLGDLGRDLPASERDYWATFAIAEERRMSQTAYRRAFLAEFSDPAAPDIMFRNVYDEFGKIWRATFSWELFRSPRPGDEHVLQRVRVPTASAPELEGQLVNLARLLVDALNDVELKARVQSQPGDQSLKKLDRWLTQEGYPEVNRDIELLKTLQLTRSKGAAHRKGSDYNTFLQNKYGSTDGAEIIGGILFAAVVMFRDLAIHFDLKVDGSED
jgi:hypothetical protein